MFSLSDLIELKFKASQFHKEFAQPMKIEGASRNVSEGELIGLAFYMATVNHLASKGLINAEQHLPQFEEKGLE